MFLLLLACAGPQDLDLPADTGHDAEPDETGADTDGDTDGETAADGFACPDGMAPVPAESPAWCIDAYEVSGAVGALVSAPGAEPLVGHTYDEAAAACAASPALDAAGEPYAMRRIATSEEWADAGDGVIGDGGAAYPWGDTFDASRCVTPTAEGSLQFDALQPTGSMPTCVSPFGLYDLVGNAWEWADSGIRLDVDTALAALLAAAVPLTEAEADGALVWSGDAAHVVSLDVAGLQPSTVRVTSDGRLEVDATQIQTERSMFFARGYVHAPDVPGPPLAIQLVPTDPDDLGRPWRAYTARTYDGATLPDKRGCAWYTGNAEACAIHSASHAHTPDFGGTIGFRCVAPPYPR